MNSRTGFLILLALAAGIWVTVLLRFKDYVVGDVEQDLSNSAAESLPFWATSERHRSSFAGNFRDPFGPVERPVVPATPPVILSATQPAEEWPAIRLIGIVGKTALIVESGDSEPVFFVEGDSLRGTVIDRVFQDSIYVRRRSNRKTYRMGTF